MRDSLALCVSKVDAFLGGNTSGKQSVRSVFRQNMMQFNVLWNGEDRLELDEMVPSCLNLWIHEISVLKNQTTLEWN